MKKTTAYVLIFENQPAIGQLVKVAVSGLRNDMVRDEDDLLVKVEEMEGVATVVIVHPHEFQRLNPDVVRANFPHALWIVISNDRPGDLFDGYVPADKGLMGHPSDFRLFVHNEIRARWPGIELPPA